MFTGIIEEIGTIKAISKRPDAAVLEIQCGYILSDLHIGDSVAVNGVCLTATRLTGHGFTADVMHETLRRSSLGQLSVGSRVNLERAMAAGGRFGGHIVSGHIDGTGVIRSLRQDGNAVWYTITCGSALLRYIIEKGSIAIDGISLTVAKVTADSFAVSIIPHTLSETILSEKRPGDTVNLENDCVGKYVERLLQTGALTGQMTQTIQTAGGNSAAEKPSGLTRAFLAEHGF